MAGYLWGAALGGAALVDRFGGDGVLSSNIEWAASVLCIVIQAGVNRIADRLPSKR